MPPRRLVLGHDATRTGAPLLLLWLLEWAVDHGLVAPRTVLRRSGPLIGSFRTLGPVAALRADGGRSLAGALDGALLEVAGGRWAGPAARREALLRTRRVRRHVDGALVNGVGAAGLLPLVPPERPCAVLVHELELAMARSAADEEREALWARADRVVAVSERVAGALASEPGIDLRSVRVAPGFVPPRPGAGDRARARADLGLDPDLPVVGCVGAGSWRKGIDLFIQVAAAVAGGGARPTSFVWVGDVERPDEVAHDLSRLGLSATVRLAGGVDDTGPWWDAFDVVLSTSREDPFPLAVLEAGRAGRAVVAFDSGGAVEVVGDGAGVVVPALDVEAMAEAVLDLLEDPVRRDALGSALRERIEADHLTPVGAPRLWAALTDGVRRDA